MEFEWDEDKAASNLRKHGLAFDDVLPAFRDIDALIELDRDEIGEDRWRLIGSINAVTIAFVVYAQRDEFGQELVRIISARRANRSERARYEQAKNG